MQSTSVLGLQLAHVGGDSAGQLAVRPRDAVDAEVLVEVLRVQLDEDDVVRAPVHQEVFPVKVRGVDEDAAFVVALAGGEAGGGRDVELCRETVQGFDLGVKRVLS